MTLKPSLSTRICWSLMFHTARALLGAIQRFLQLEHAMTSTYCETLRLMHVDVCVDVAIEEHVADVD